MRKFLLLLAIALGYSFIASSQDQTNKGKEFWISYPEHINGTGSIMGIYITSDVTTSGVITVNGSNIPFTVFANTIITNFIGTGGVAPNTYIHLGNLQDGIKTNAAVHVTALQPVVVYAHIINSARSGASLILPTKVWGKEYVVPSYANSGGNGAGQGFGELNVMASLPNTVVEITPQITTRNGLHAAGVPYTVTLANPGDVYQVQFPQSTDLSGTLVKSIASGSSGCQPIAVIAATTWTALNCGSGTGGDNFYQQLFPYGSWGKEFITSPLKKTSSTTDHNVDILRVFVKDPTTVVQKTENGVTSTLTGLNAGNFYEYSTEYPTFIQADKPIQLMQYIKSQNCNAPGSPQTQSDPEMIALSSVEQTINDITVYSAIQSAVPGGNSAVNVHYINVTMKTANTGTFKINGAPPTGTFIPIPSTNYSYLKQSISSATPVSRLTADSGFSAIAYGFGNVESYGYNAGTNVKDLNRQLEVSTPYGSGTETSPNVCTGSPFQFKVYFPDSTAGAVPEAIRYDSIRWDCSNTTVMTPNNFPLVILGTPKVNPDSTNIRNGKSVAWYSLPALYSFNTPGVYDITITLYRTSTEGCGNEQDYVFQLTVTDPPVADFSYTAGGCYAEPYAFRETTPQTPKTTYKFWWDFGDPASGPLNNTSNQRNPSHIFSGPSPAGGYRVRFADITTPGCLSDTVEHYVIVPDLPKATIAGTVTACINTGPVPITFTGTDGTAPYTYYYNINGGGALSSPTGLVNAPTTTAGTFVYTLDSVRNTGSTTCVRTITGQQATVTVTPDASISLATPGADNQLVCINKPIAQIKYNIGGSATNATVTNLPPGVTYTYAGGVVTITGSPTNAGGYTYTVATDGPCQKPSLSGVISVTPDATISWQAGSGALLQDVCINKPMQEVRFDVGGSATAVTITPALPGGLTAFLSGGVYRISGSPTSGAGTSYIYTVSANGPCEPATATGRINIIADGAVTVNTPATVSQTVCINNPIATIKYGWSGSATSATVSGLPAGVGGAIVGSELVITGTPTVPGSFTYMVTPAGGPCDNPFVTGTINVNNDAFVDPPTGAPSQAVCINTSISTISYTLSGGATTGTVTGLAGSGITWTYTAATKTITISGTATAAGTYNYTVNATGPCLPDSKNGTITVNPDHTISLFSGPGTQSVCENTAIADIFYTVGGGGNDAAVTGLPAGVNFLFDIPTSRLRIWGTPTNVTATTTYNFIVTTTGNSCQPAQAFGSITVKADGEISLGSGITTQEVCKGVGIGQIVFNIAGGATGATISPALPAGITGVYNAGTKTYTIAGIPTVAAPTQVYTISTQGSTCVEASQTITLTVHELPTVSFNISAPNCENQDITFTSTSVPNSGTINTWMWDFGDGNTDNTTGGVVTHKYATPNTYTATLRVITDKGCPNAAPDATKTFTVYANPAAAFNVPQACVNDIVHFTDASTPAGNISTWEWDFGDIASGPNNTANGQNNGNHQFTSPNTYQVKLTVTSVNGCKGTTINPITINAANPTPAFTVTNRNTLCSSDTVYLTNQSTVAFGNVTKLEIWWDNLGAPGTVITDNAPVAGGQYKHKYPTLQTDKVYQVRMRAYSGTVCFNDHIDNITVYATPKVKFDPLPDACWDAAPYVLTQGSEIGGVPGPPGVYSGPGITGGNTFNPNSLVPGQTYTIKYTFTSSSPGACFDTLSQTILVRDTASAKFSYNQPVCIGSVVTFRDESFAPAGINIANVTWNFGDGSPAEVHPLGATVTHNYGVPNTYPVTVYNTTDYGCKSKPSTQSVTISPLPVVTFGPVQSSVCLPDAKVDFTNTSTGSNLTYTWDFDDPASGVYNASSGVTPSHTFTGQGPYTVRLTAKSDVGCVKTGTTLIDFIHPQPKAAFNTSKPTACLGDEITFTDASDYKDGTPLKWDWKLGDGSLKAVSSFKYTYASADTFYIEYFVQNSHQCYSDTLKLQPFPVYDYPRVYAGDDRTILEGGSVKLDPTVTGQDLQYVWSPPLYLNDNKLKQPTASLVKQDIRYSLSVTGIGNCTAPLSYVFIKVLQFPQIPNTFTPNNDGINDVWNIQYLNTYPDNRVQVFTRTGQLVFESKGYGKPWDGTLKGKPLPIDTYYYVIEPGNGRDPITGYVTILK